MKPRISRPRRSGAGSSRASLSLKWGRVYFSASRESPLRIPGWKNRPVPFRAIRDAFDRRMRNWSIRRNGVDRLPLSFHRRRVYILPTGFGLLYGFILFGMLLAGLNYNNNLALALAFTLGSLAVVAMHFCHRNLAGIELCAVEAEPVFAGEAGVLRVELVNTSRLERLDIELRADDAAAIVVSLAA